MVVTLLCRNDRQHTRQIAKVKKGTAANVPSIIRFSLSPGGVVINVVLTRGLLTSFLAGTLTKL